MRGCFIWCCIFRFGTVSVAPGHMTRTLSLSFSLRFSLFCFLSSSPTPCVPIAASLLPSLMSGEIQGRLIKMPANSELQPPLKFPCLCPPPWSSHPIGRITLRTAYTNDHSLWYSALFLSEYIGRSDLTVPEQRSVRLGWCSWHSGISTLPVSTSRALILSSNRDLPRS